MGVPKYIPRTAGLLAVVAAVMIFSASGAYSAGAASLGISPPIVDLTVEPGKDATFDVYLGNNSDRAAVRLKVLLAPVEQDRSGAYRVVEQPGPWSAVPWLKLDKAMLDIPPGKGASVGVKAVVPRGASGSRAAAVVFEVVPEQGPDRQITGIGGTTTFVYRLTTVVKVTANSRANRRDARVVSLAVARGSNDPRLARYGEKALAIVCAAQNEGNTLINGRGQLLIRRADGRRFREVPLGGDKGVILPGATVDFLSIFPSGLPEGQYTAEAVIRYGGFRPLQARMPFEVKREAIAAQQASVLETVRLASAPEVLEGQLPPGAVRTFLVTLVNREAEPLPVKGKILGLAADDDGGLLPSEAVDGRWSAANWLSLEPPSFVLAPGEKRNARVMAAIPKDAEAGSHYASVVFEADEVRPDGSGGQKATTTVSTPIIISIGRQLVRKAVITDANVVPVTKPEGLVVGGDLVNEGATHLIISGRVILRRRAAAPTLVGGMEYLGEAKFEDVATIPLSQSEGWLLPGTSRLVAILYEKPLEPGEYQAEMVVDFGGELPARATVTFMVAPKGTDAKGLPVSPSGGKGR